MVEREAERRVEAKLSLKSGFVPNAMARSEAI
jgi:hypothetical protein